MSKKFRIFNYQTNIEWYDIKTKFKHIIRSVGYSKIFQEILCFLIKIYLHFVFISSKKIWINQEILLDAAKNKKPVILSFWHNRLTMIPFIATNARRAFSSYNFMTLASKHGDGKFVGLIMEKFGFISIYGSTRDKKKPERGIDFSSMRQIIEGLKHGYSLGMTPDGPRGPNQKINGELLNISRLCKAPILVVSYSSSRFIEFKTWDRFRMPLPFSRLCFYIDKNPIFIAKDTSEEDLQRIKKLCEERMDFAQSESFLACVKNITSTGHASTGSA